MERLLLHTTLSLAGEFDVTLIGPRGCRAHVPEKVAAIECPQNPIAFLLLSLLKGLRHCLSRRYSYVLAGNGLVAPVAILLAKRARAVSLVYVHGLDLVAQQLFYQRFFVPWVVRADTVIANSKNTKDIAIKKGCADRNVRILHPGTHLPPIMEDEARAQHRKTLYGDAGLAVLFVGRIVSRKGLSKFIEKSWPKVLSEEPSALLLVVGDSPNAAASVDSTEIATVRELQREAKLGESIRFLGVVSDDLLNQHYAAADALIFPIVDIPGDVEGFGMVAVEAAAHGTPTVAFASGGVVDAVADGSSGRLIRPGDYNAFSENTLQVARASQSFRDGCRAHAETFSWPRHGKKLLRIMSESSARLDAG